MLKRVVTASRSEPLTFASCSGRYYPASGDTGVVLCSPWGYEDLCTRQTWRLLAESIAQAGLPCLCFDYPGTGDSAGEDLSITSLASWQASVMAASSELKLVSGVRRVVLLGQGLGATLAWLAAGSITGVVGLGLLAPVINGRQYVRSLGIWEKMIAGDMGYTAPDPEIDGVSHAGFALARPLVEALQTIDLAQQDAPP